MKKKKSVVVNQKKPKKNKNKAVWDLVLKDIKERDQNGMKKYGTRLQPFNGRNALVDAYQEVLDLIVYFRQSIAERERIVELLKSGMSVESMKSGDLFVFANECEVLLDVLGELDGTT